MEELVVESGAVGSVGKAAEHEEVVEVEYFDPEEWQNGG